MCSSDLANFNGFGRCYRNWSDKGYIPEVYVNGSATEYEQVFFDDTTLAALFFFSCDDSTDFKKGASATTKCSIIFICNLALIKPNYSFRADEETRQDVEKLCAVNRNEFMMTGIEIGYNKVFSDFSGLVNKDGTVFRDRHPLHVFRINGYFLYNLLSC